MFDENTLSQNGTFLEALKYAQDNHKLIHLIGLVSDGGVHSHIKHLKGICSIAHEHVIKDVFVHVFTDGRDCDPKSGLGFLKELQSHLDQTTGQIASVTGRYYAMDRDKRWSRVKLAYDAMVHGEGKATTNIFKSVEESYAKDVTDEFIKPIIHLKGNGTPLATIREGDVVMCFNFRTDRGRQITMALSQQDFPQENMHKMDL